MLLIFIYRGTAYREREDSPKSLIVDRALLVLVSGKLVLQKNILLFLNILPPCFGSLTGDTFFSKTNCLSDNSSFFCNRSHVWGHNWGWNQSLSYNLAYGKAVSDWRQPFQTSSGRHHQTNLLHLKPPLRNIEINCSWLILKDFENLLLLKIDWRNIKLEFDLKRLVLFLGTFEHFG